MTEPSVEEWPPGTTRDHPPFRMRDRRRLLLPDIRPPSLDEIRWAARQRRDRRIASVPEPRQHDAHELLDQRESADVVTSIEEPIVQAVDAPDAILLPEAGAPAAEAPFDLTVEDIDLTVEDIDLTVEDLLDASVEDDAEVAAEASVEDDAEVVAEASVEASLDLAVAEKDEESRPLVSQILVVREPAAPDPGRIAVLDDVAAQPPTVTRLVPLPVEASDALALEPTSVEDAVDEDDREAATDDRPAPLYWRLLRLRYTRPNGWLRALFFEGAVAIGVVLVLAEAASVWTIVVLPVVVAVVVKANDVLAGSLRRTYRQPGSRVGR